MRASSDNFLATLPQKYLTVSCNAVPFFVFSLSPQEFDLFLFITVDRRGFFCGFCLLVLVLFFELLL